MAAVAAAVLTVAAAAVLLRAPTESPDWDPATIDVTALAHMPAAADALPAWRARATARPADALEHEGLGRLLLRHGREAGDDGSFAAAEAAFRRALAGLPGHRPSRLGLAHALAAQHRFDEARSIAESLWREAPDQPQALALVADAAIETGEYADAEEIVSRLVADHATPAALARLARLRELQGNRDEAIHLLERGAVIARDAGALGERVAWYLMRLADLHLGAGRQDRALAHARVAVAAAPGHLGARVTRARVLTARQDWRGAIGAYEELIEVMPHPEILAALGDVYHAAGEPIRARKIWARVLEAGDEAGPAEDRPMARFLADHDLRPAEAMRRARRDLESRADVHGWDNLAWALLKAGEIDEAHIAMGRALRLGTRQADMLYHAGMIASARGRRREAIRLLRETLELAPTFDPLQAPRARAELDRLLAR